MDVIFFCNNCNWRQGAFYVGRFTRFTRSHRLLEINKYGFCSLFTGKYNFLCCPGVENLHPIFKPYREIFVCTPGPIMGDLQLSFQNKMTKSLARKLSSSDHRTLLSNPLIFFFPSSSSSLLVYSYLTIYNVNIL